MPMFQHLKQEHALKISHLLWQKAEGLQIERAATLNKQQLKTGHRKLLAKLASCTPILTDETSPASKPPAGTLLNRRLKLCTLQDLHQKE